MHSQQPVRSLSYVWSNIRRHMYRDEDPDQHVRGMRLLKDRSGAAFDIPSDHEDLIEIANSNSQRVSSGPTFEVATEMPDLQEREVQRPEPRRWGGRRNGGRNGRSGGRGRSFGGRGRRQSFGGRGRRSWN